MWRRSGGLLDTSIAHAEGKGAMTSMLELHIPEDLRKYLEDRDGFEELAQILRRRVSFEQLEMGSIGLETWQNIGLWYFHQEPRRSFEAMTIFSTLYEHMLATQCELGKRIHKGMPLVWIAECFAKEGFVALRKRYLMLALCEDAVRDAGAITANTSGIYFRLVWRLGMTDRTLRKYADAAYRLAMTSPAEAMFPEWILLNLDQGWMTEIPTASEANLYFTSASYGKHLMDRLGASRGTSLEWLAEYLMRCMPGCRTARRQNSPSTDYDVICSMDGFDVDFRSELGRYFVCECKDWAKPAGFSEFAKFCRVLDSVKSRFGIFFSKKGISGEGRTEDAAREQLKVFQDRGIVIVVVNEEDLNQVLAGANFVSVLREKYERVRLDLRSTKR